MKNTKMCKFTNSDTNTTEGPLHKMAFKKFDFF